LLETGGPIVDHLFRAHRASPAVPPGRALRLGPLRDPAVPATPSGR
jgi:hypothetical protein